MSGQAAKHGLSREVLIGDGGIERTQPDRRAASAGEARE
jgi:hypothetical protein